MRLAGPGAVDGSPRAVDTRSMPPAPLSLYPLRPLSGVPAVTATQMAEIDRLALDDAHLTLLQMMENAGRSLALVVRDYLPSAGSSILILAGSGRNGGGALTAARHLRNWGFDVRVVLTAAPGALHEATAQQHQILHKDGLRALWPGAPEFDDRFPEVLAEAGVVVDGLVGYGLRGPLSGDVAVLTEAVLDRAPPAVVALDVPTGFNATTGAVEGAGIVATATVTLALPKTGLLKREAAAAVGDLLLADIGIPAYIPGRLGLPDTRGLFADGPIVRLVATD